MNTTLRVAILTLFVVLSSPVHSDSSDRTLLLEMEIDIAIRETSKVAMIRARERAQDAIEKTSIYARYKASSEKALALSRESSAFYKKYTDDFSIEKENELQLNELVSGGFPETRTPRYRADFFLCSATYEYGDHRQKPCSDLEIDISSTMARYFLYVRNSSRYDAAIILKDIDCNATESVIAQKYPRLKKYVDNENVAKKKSDRFRQESNQAVDESMAIYSEMRRYWIPSRGRFFVKK